MQSKHKSWLLFFSAVVMTVLIVALLVDIFEKKQQARLTYIKITEIEHGEPDPEKWKTNFPREFDAYMKTVKTSELFPYSKWGRYGGSEAFSHLEHTPNMKRLFAGYAFSVEYKEERGHMNALNDMLSTPRLGDQKPGSCMTCKSPQVPQFIEEYGAAAFYKTPVKELVEKHGFEHSISCADCHDASTAALKVTRPAYIEAQARRGIDVAESDHARMRTDVCVQCHVEYYWKKPDNYLTFPWDKGMIVDSIEAYYDSIGFYDWVHAETGAHMIKMQHPEHEMWSSGIHARAGVGCADCHMPYVREGSVKVTDHWIRSPLMNITNACLVCHRESEEEMASRVLEIQDRTHELLVRSELAIVSAIDQIVLAIKVGATDAELDECRHLHRRAQLRWDFVSAENSMGFHSPQESVRTLGDAIDFARQSEISALKVYLAHGGEHKDLSFLDVSRPD